MGEVTEREAVLRERAAYLWGWRQGRPVGCFEGDANREAERRYPLPKVTRRRRVLDPHGLAVFSDPVFWTVLDGQRKGVFAVHGDGCSARYQGMPAVTPERNALWADLLANPTEEVEDVG